MPQGGFMVRMLSLVFVGALTLQAAAPQQAEAGSQALVLEIEQLAQRVSNLQSTAWLHRDRLNDLRRRAQNYMPDQPGHPSSDPLLQSDIQQYASDIRNFASNVDGAKDEVFNLSGQAGKGSELVAPAQRLEVRAESLRSSAQWLKDDALEAMVDMRRVGFFTEAYAIEREISRAPDSSLDLKNEALALAEKVK